MELIDQRTKKIMEECKVRARDAGLKFDDETLEYIVTNRDLIELSPKVMIPTLYDYWVNDVEVLRKKGEYQLYPSNPYETVINTRPAISFYNDNNPDWLNIMIFYHVLGHIDFFQNNVMFENTWNYDFAGQALADKRLLANLRTEHGRWVDYTIEFCRGMDNLVGYYETLAKLDFPKDMLPSSKIDYYFDNFLQIERKVPLHEYYKEIERYNNLISQNKNIGESIFFSEVKSKYPEFQAKFKKFKLTEKEEPVDIMEFIMENSPFLQKEKNTWMKLVLSIVRNTSLYFSPQIRTKTINEGWASYWHDKLFRSDERISGHEVAYAKVNSYVTSISRVGLNPYAIGLRLIQSIEDLSDKGRMNFDFQRIGNIEQREKYDKKTGNGQNTIFEIRKKFSDFTLINTFVNQDFVDQHDLFVVGKRLNEQRGVFEYYVKSRKAEDYKEMLLNSAYHPPRIEVNKEKTNDDNLYLTHKFEGKEIFKGYIGSVLMGAEYLWGSQTQLETTDIIKKKAVPGDTEVKYEYRKVLYTMKNRNITKMNL